MRFLLLKSICDNEPKDNLVDNTALEILNLSDNSGLNIYLIFTLLKMLLSGLNPRRRLSPRAAPSGLMILARRKLRKILLRY